MRLRCFICLSLLNLSLSVRAQPVDLWMQAQAAYAQGNYRQALDFSAQYQARLPPSDSLARAEAFHLAANTYYELAEYLTALDHFDLSLALCPADPTGQNLKGMVLFDRAFAEYELEEYIPAYESTRKAEAILSELAAPNWDYLLSIYADLAYTARGLGFYADAELYIQRGEALSQQYASDLELPPGSARKAVIFACERALLYADWNREEAALAALRKLESLDRQQAFNAEEQRRYAVSLNAVADMYLNHRDTYAQPFATAHRLLDRAFAALDTSLYASHYWQFTFNRAKAWRHAADLTQALAINTKLLATCEPTDHRLPFFWAQRGLIFLPQQADSACAAFRQMVSYLHRGASPLGADFSNFCPSNVLHHAGLLVEIADEILARQPTHTRLAALAADFYRLGLRQFRQSFDGRSFNPKLRTYYEKAIGGILRTGNTSDPAALESLLEQIDYIENRFAWQRFQHSRALRMRGSQAAPYRQRLSLHQQIITAQQQGATAQVQALRDALRELEELPASGSEAQSEGGVLQQLRATLAPKQLVLKYQACGSRLYCFGIAADTLWVQHLPVAAHWPQAVERFWADIRRQASVALQGARLGRQLLPQAIDNYQELIIVPGASLANLPFQALSHRGDYLLSTHTISYAPHLIFIGAGSAQPILESKPASLVLAPIGAQARAAAEGLAVRAATDRLRGAAAEGLSVAQNLAATLLDENTATKPRVLAALPQAEWVHVATHAVYDSAAPNLSYLQLAAGDRLYLEEVYGLSMQAKLVLLSACQTATSRPQSNRLQAFHRAFFQAGVPSVVAGLWELPDQATQQVVEQFYAELAQGRSAADALRHAQLACLARTDGAYAHPFFWAGLIVQGDTKVVPATRKTKRWMWLFGLAGVLLLGAAIILWRRAQSRSGRGQALQQIE